MNFIRKQMKVNVLLEKIYPGFEINLLRKHRIFDLDQSLSQESGEEGQWVVDKRVNE